MSNPDKSVTERLEDLHSEMDNHELVEEIEGVEVDATEGIDEIHITVTRENLDEVESEVEDFDWQLSVLYTDDLNDMKPEIEDDDEYKLVVGYAGRI